MTRSELMTALADFFDADGSQPNDRPPLEEELDLFESGYLDSLSTFEMALFIEERFAIKLPLQRMSPSEIRSVGALHSALVARRIVAS
jgi:acyl carrier protein